MANAHEVPIACDLNSKISRKDNEIELLKKLLVYKDAEIENLRIQLDDANKSVSFVQWQNRSLQQ